MAQRLDTLMPRACGGGGRPVILSILFVSLFACSLATSSLQQPPVSWRHSSLEQQQQQPHQAGLLDSYFEPLYERPTEYAAPQQDSADDEHFLRQLKVAAEYLDEKLAAREREQQQRALLAKLGRLVGSSSSLASAGQGPAYSLGGGGGGYDTGSGQEGNDVVVVAPSVDYSGGGSPATSDSNSLASSTFDSPNYRLLNDATSDSEQPSEQEQQQQQQLETYDNYKQLLQTLLGSSDRAHPTESGELGAPVKRESDSADVKFDHERPKLTTLIEDEEDAKSSTTTSPESPANETTTTSRPLAQTPAAAYGKVVYKQNNASASPPAASSSESGVFGRLYAQLSRYLPFMSQISILRHGSQSSGDNETKIFATSQSGADQVNHNHHDKQQLTVKVSKQDGGDLEAEESRVRPHAKQSVSVSPSTHNENEDKKRTEDQDNQKPEDVNEHSRVKVSLVKNKDDDDDKSEQQQVVVASKSGNTKRLISVSGPDNAELSELEMPGQMMPVVVKSPHYNHLIRPAQDQTEADQSVGSSGSLLGKYIYAPTQHYYLNSPLPTTSGAGHHQVAGARHFRPGDDVYGSYAADSTPMRAAAYAFQKDPSMIVNSSPNNLVNKTNDLYFLVMVGAFCVMAMAVVLAAGAFAYRVQQSRKSSQDTDYPTYGVVGPNNMSSGGNGKCGGASAFTMGGYFMGPPGGVGGATSKSGSAKHLADLYGAHANSVVSTTSAGVNHGGSDSGLNSLGRSSHHSTNTATLGNSAKKTATAQSSSASSLNNGQDQHHQASGRHAPGSFMSAASQDAARMYHYQHQKQQMIISDRNSTAGGRHTSASDLDSEDENDDGSYTVYECPGLASAHEMEIKNPLFNDDQTP